jgi:hypothetical protein
MKIFYEDLIGWIGHVERMEDSRTPKRVMREHLYLEKKR